MCRNLFTFPSKTARAPEVMKTRGSRRLTTIRSYYRATAPCTHGYNNNCAKGVFLHHEIEHDIRAFARARARNVSPDPDPGDRRRKARANNTTCYVWTL